ncbi:hypothetical protein [Streptomyces sp. ISL-94]|uniref:hypothetical protein n=1 Tax=Streptomyces sp. ISL-94 TaxID=2819190 RepID=UPI001BEA6A26|nr:hypothetical protein [Streptomyces sp. ISL-94]MBT2481691.1 hypothetical protein [Streptomyces sp. ISL-94]
MPSCEPPGRAGKEAALPGPRVEQRGDIVDTVTGSHYDADNDIEVTKTFYWSGKGAPKALPFPAAAPGEVPLTRAFAATDDDRVGGTVVDRQTRTGNAVLWTCASKQAYTPQG